MIAGFEEPNGGEILIDGNDVAGLPAHKRPTNTVFQSYALFPHLSVRDNVAYGLKRKNVDKAEIDEPRPGRARAGRARERGEPASRTSSPAASSSASRSPAPSSTCRRCCCSTSRSAPST